jgi:hypothetical protein
MVKKKAPTSDEAVAALSRDTPVTSRRVSPEFIAALRDASASSSLLRALEKQHGKAAGGSR